MTRWTPVLVLAACATPAREERPAVRPNLVVILADDLGYGDVRCNNPQGRIPTPNIDRLAAQGVRFTDAHAPATVCSPTRYALLTGRYAWRTRLKTNVLWQWDPPLIDAERLTLAELLHEHGYRTAALGKWHLGLNWPFASAEAAAKLAENENQDQALCSDIDWSRPITGGPLAHGFDTYFGVNCPNFSPYVFLEDDHIVGAAPSEQWPGLSWRLSQHSGPAQAGFDRHQIAPTIARKAVEWIESCAETPEQPFFLYFAMTGPHSPIVPNEEFRGRSGIGDYGDFVVEMDWAVGQVLDALERSGVARDTLVVFTSDNGPERWNYEEVQEFGHYAMGDLRGVKRDLWEGGHRVPFLASWPTRIEAGALSSEVICHTDLMATMASILGAELPEDAGEDSYDVLPALLGDTSGTPIRAATVHHAVNGKLAIRSGDWVFIEAKTGEVSKEPQWFKDERGYAPHEFPGELYDLRQDLPERRNLYGERPDVVERLRALLERYRSEGRSAPRMRS